MSSSWISTTLGDTLLRSDGSKVELADALAGQSVLGLYFSAHWCPPCRHFTPTLSAKYTALKNAGKKIEIVFVSSDRDEASFKQYHSEMSFLALPFSARGAKAALADRFGVQGIPMLVFVDAQTGELLTKDGRTAISASSFIADFPYRASAAQLAAQNADASPSPLQLLLVCAVLYFVYTKYFAPAGSNLH